MPVKNGGINLASETEGIQKTRTVPKQMYRFSTPGLCGSSDVPAPDTPFSRFRIVGWVCPAPSRFSPACPPDGSIKQKRKHGEIMSLMYSKIGN